MCWRQSHLSQTDGAARELRRMALKYQQDAAALNGGKVPDLADQNDGRERA
jgi:hypothetical protein